VPESISETEVGSLTALDKAALDWQLNWRSTARDNQLQPQGMWSIWGVIAGRGFGKTRVGAEWTAAQAWLKPNTIGHVIAPTFSDVAQVCFEGPSGIMAIIPPELIDGEFNKTDLILKLKNGSMLRGFSAEKPSRLRGPQCHFMWCDELAAWQRAEEAWDMAMFGLRLGDHTRALFTTTPRPIPLIRSLMENPKNVITRGTTYENKANLSANFYEEIITKYEGTTLGRQELNAELIDPEEAGIIKRSWIKLWPADKKLPVLEWIVISLDTAFTEATRDKKTGESDPTACTVWGLFRHEGKDGILLLDCWEEHLGMPDLLKRIPKELDIRYGDQDEPLIKPKFGPTHLGGGGRKADMLIIEDKGSGISLRQMLEREGIYAVAYNPGRAGKLERLHGVAHLFANGMVWMVESQKHRGQPRSWADPLIAQLCAFSGEGTTKHDDFVDSTSQALRLIIDQSRVSVRRPRTPDAPPIYEKPAANPYG
jgi:predicted phage terminase large subunit-like protein